MVRASVFKYWTVFVVLAVLVSTANGYERILEKRLKAAEGGSLLLETDRGSVRIASHPGEEAHIKMQVRFLGLNEREAEALLQDIQYSFDSDGRNVVVRVALPDKGVLGRSRWNTLRLAFEVKVPRAYDVVVKTSGGGIDIDDLRGDVTVRTSGGHVRLGHIEGDIEARTSGGSIDVERCDGSALLRTSGGGITVGVVEGEIEARTSGGPVTIQRAGSKVIARTSGGNIMLHDVPGDVQAVTSGGSIRASIRGPILEDCIFRTSGGNLSVTLSPEARFHLYARTSGGSIVSEFPVTIQGKFSKNLVEGDVNGGGPTFTLRTSGGNIYLRKR